MASARAHIRIAMLMSLVAMLAMNFAAIRVLVARYSRINELAAVGIMPMANVLGGGALLFLWGGRGSRPFLRGFLGFGTAAILVYSACSAFATESFYELIGSALEAIFRRLLVRPPIPAVIGYPIAGFVATAPQLLVAWSGGMLSAWLGSRRRAQRAEKTSGPEGPEVSQG